MKTAQLSEKTERNDGNAFLSSSYFLHFRLPCYCLFIRSTAQKYHSEIVRRESLLCVSFFRDLLYKKGEKNKENNTTSPKNFQARSRVKVLLSQFWPKAYPAEGRKSFIVEKLSN